MRRLSFSSYINFGLEGSRADRVRFARGLYDALARGAPLPLSGAPYANALRVILDNPELRLWCAEGEAFAEAASAEILSFIDSVFARLLQETPPDTADRALSAEIAALPRRAFLDAWPSIAAYLDERYSGALDASFITCELSAPRLTARSFARLREHLLSQIRRLLDAEDRVYRARVFDELGGAFLDELCGRIRTLRGVRAHLTHDPEETGRLWNAAKGSWQKAGYAVLEEYGRYAERDLELSELARSLGRSHRLSSPRAGAEPEGQSLRSAGELEIDGAGRGADLNLILPQEAALLSDAELDALFYRKWRERALLVFNTQSAALPDTRAQCGCPGGARTEAGPFVLCIDTSGSMRGAGEKTAKSLVFALLKEAFSRARRCYLISFSTEIAALELSDLAASLDSLIKFLEMSFYGGSHIENALSEALCALERDAYRDADVVVVSDFVLPAPSADLAGRILAAREGGSLFHAILIGSLTDTLVTRGVLDLFDTVRAYDVF
jgi:uncharacterized protein with von Willebrand factor type A (vWA) domain